MRAASKRLAALPRVGPINCDHYGHRTPLVTTRQLGKPEDSNLSREIRRNGRRDRYDAERAEQRYRQHLQDKGRPRPRWHQVFDEAAVPLLEEGWSPEQISGVFRDSECRVSHEWLYQRIADDKRRDGQLYRLLRCQKQRRKRYGSPERRGQIKDRRSISERPAKVETREEIGHWEADTMIGAGQQGALVTLVERKTGLTRIAHVPTKEAAGVTKAICRMLAPLKGQVKSITFDNGKEFAGHATISRRLKADCYFADPYSSWQRGSNENTNGLIRQYFPKKTSFAKVKPSQIAEVERKLNNRPRKRLGFKSPNYAFEQAKSLN
ncbi:IS30 family transposase [Chitinilyticum piscinae]|nr:IS30 family transposase [Chitinilyticum piscinae]